MIARPAGYKCPSPFFLPPRGLSVGIHFTMSFSRILFPRLIIILGGAFVLACVGAVYQINRIVVTPQEFRSQAKLLADVKIINLELEDREIEHSSGTTAETLESAEMSRRAVERVKALNPDIHGGDVAIHATQTKGSGIIHILATGQEPRYTRLFLDALLDEFIAFRRDNREKAQGPVLQKVLQEAATLQKEMKESEAALEKARASTSTSTATISANLDHVRLQARLTVQRNQRDEHRRAIKDMPESDGGRALLQTRLSAIELEIKDIESQLQRHEAAASELRVLTEKFDAAKQACDQKFEQAEKLQTSIDTDPDSVAIMERAAPASEKVEDWKLPVAIGAGGGALLGGFIGLMTSLALVRSPKPQQVPRGF